MRYVRGLLTHVRAHALAHSHKLYCGARQTRMRQQQRMLRQALGDHWGAVLDATDVTQDDVRVLQVATASVHCQSLCPLAPISVTHPNHHCNANRSQQTCGNSTSLCASKQSYDQRSTSWQPTQTLAMPLCGSHRSLSCEVVWQHGHACLEGAPSSAATEQGAVQSVRASFASAWRSCRHAGRTSQWHTQPLRAACATHRWRTPQEWLVVEGRSQHTPEAAVQQAMAHLAKGGRTCCKPASLSRHRRAWSLVAHGGVTSR